MSLADQQWCPTSVQVTVLQARGLRIKGKSGTNDAYAVMQVGKEKYQTSVVEKSVAPVWKEEAAFDLPPLYQGGGGGGTERSTLHVHVLHRALVGPDKLLGQAVINLLQLSEDKTRNKTEWFKLLDKTGKADKDRGEVLVDIQFMRNNMTASMFDLSAAGKSRSRLGKFKDKVRGKKKESDAASTVVPSFSQVLTDSEEEGNGEDEVAAGKDEKKKKHKMKSLFSPKSNLQKNMSQSMSVLPAKNSSLSGSQSSGLNMDSSEGKKKFKFMIHKRSGSSDSKDSSSGHQKHGAVEQSNLCINGSHVYCEEPQPRTSRIGSNFSLTSSGHGSMEDVPESSPPSDSLRAVRQYSPWTEEEEETAEVENITEDVGELRREEEERVRRQKIELERLAEEKRRQEVEKRTEEEKVKREEEERIRREKEEKAQEERRQEEEEMVRRQEKELEEKKRLEEQERRKREEEERIKNEEKARREKEEYERLLEEKRKLEEEERQRIEAEEKIRREEKERIRVEEERTMKEEEERVRRQEEEREKLAEKKRILEEQERRIEEEKRQEEERIRMKEETAQEERRRQEEECKLAEEKRRLEDERRIEEEKVRKEERAQEESRRREEEEMVRRQEKELEEKRRLEEQERRQREEEERIKKEKARREKEEYERLLEEKRKLEEEERQRIEAEEKIRREEEERIRVEEERRMKEEEERVRRQEEESEKLAEKKRILEEQERRRIEEEKRREEERIRKDERRRQEEQLERLAEEKRRREEERKRTEEEKVKREEERAQEERRREEEKARKEKEEMERLAEKRRLEEQEKKSIEEEERIRLEEKAKKEMKEEQAMKLEKEKLVGDAEEQKKRENKTKHKAAGKKSEVAVESPAEVPSNPFDENFSNNPFEEIPDSPAGAHSSTTKVSTVQQGCQSAVSSMGSKTVSTDEKDLISYQREKRPAPQPPGRIQAESQREQDGSTPHLAQISKQSKDKDVKAVSVLPQRSVQMIAPLSRSPTDTKYTQSLPQSSTTKGTTNVGKHSKRPAPSRPRSVEEGPSSEPKTAPSSDGNISHECGSEAKQEQIVYGLNPFEDDENELTSQDDTTTSGETGSIQWPLAVSQAADKDAASQTKIKSSKVARAPPLPATSSNQNAEGGHVTDDTGVTVPDNSVTHACDPKSEAVSRVHVHETPLQESRPATVQSAGEEAGGKKEGPPTTSRRLQPVKPLNPLEQKSVSVVQGGKDNKSTGILCEVQKKTKVNDSGLKGPYSQLTQAELISLVLKQKNQLSERDKKISELEQYIDNLLVRVIEEQPSILMSMNSQKKPV
ncbi:rab11 family-interacting protein 1-like [Siniperca chuatsi]|uniref:rab11 family-interacting protein 1-like n=1 Tax=Siniperca chuatsi TaxID=119488 RepID=UPI001CE057A1|nr:rab11 family-interacting protein 1-like [Siniperca chuatsi]